MDGIIAEMRFTGKQKLIRRMRKFGDAGLKTRYLITRARPSRADQRQGPAHRRHMYAHAVALPQRRDQQFARPSRSWPTVVLRCASHDPFELGQDVLAQLRFGVVFAGVQQASPNWRSLLRCGSRFHFRFVGDML